MLFWVLLVITILIALYSAWSWLDGYGGVLESLFMGLMSGVVAACVSGGILFAAVALSWQTHTVDKASEETNGLRAIATSESTDGQFFLGTGYIDGHRTLNFIQQVDDYSEVGQARADRSKVFEDSDDPTVTIHSWDQRAPWVLPWVVQSWKTYDFHVPAESVMEDYTISNT